MRVEAYVDRGTFIVGYATGKRVLDCGMIGATELPLDKRVSLIPDQLHYRLVLVADVMGTDYSPELVAEVSAAYPELRLVAADMETIELDETFDLVIMGDLIEHLSNAGLALDRAHALLREGGEVLITCPNTFGLPNWIRFLAGRFREGGDHVHSFNQWTLTNLLGRHGYDVVRLLTCLDHEPTGHGRKMLFRLIQPLLKAAPRFGGTLIVVAAPRHVSLTS